MQDAGIEVDRELSRGRLAFVSERDYLEVGRWSTENMLSFLQKA